LRLPDRRVREPDAHDRRAGGPARGSSEGAHEALDLSTPSRLPIHVLPRRVQPPAQRPRSVTKGRESPRPRYATALACRTLVSRSTSSRPRTTLVRLRATSVRERESHSHDRPSAYDAGAAERVPSANSS